MPTPLPHTTIDQRLEQKSTLLANLNLEPRRLAQAIAEILREERKLAVQEFRAAQADGVYEPIQGNLPPAGEMKNEAA